MGYPQGHSTRCPSQAQQLSLQRRPRALLSPPRPHPTPAAPQHTGTEPRLVTTPLFIKSPGVTKQEGRSTEH